MDAARAIELVLARTLKPRGFRKRARNWFRTTAAGEYQVASLQKSSWGGGQCYLRLGWDAALAPGQFHPESRCALGLNAEHTSTIPPIEWSRPDGVPVELPGIVLLDPSFNTRLSERDFVDHLTNVVAIPIADLLDRTPSIVDLVPLLTAKPSFATPGLRTQLAAQGVALPQPQSRS